ncbi:MAG: hypothetical protein QOK12_4055, partial [Mycobacterium sp.]|nr:hypothetical protein [Mycobacterium sp.]
MTRMTTGPGPHAPELLVCLAKPTVSPSYHRRVNWTVDVPIDQLPDLPPLTD